MSIFVAWKLSQEDSEVIYEWQKSCRFLDKPVHPDHLCIPLAHNGGPRMDSFVPEGSVDYFVNFSNPSIKRVGERGTIALTFNDDAVKTRKEELAEEGFRQRHNFKFFTMPISIHCHTLDYSWIRSFPLKQVRIVEEFAIPFDPGFGKYAHLPLVKSPLRVSWDLVDLTGT